MILFISRTVRSSYEEAIHVTLWFTAIMVCYPLYSTASEGKVRIKSDKYKWEDTFYHITKIPIKTCFQQSFPNTYNVFKQPGLSGVAWKLQFFFLGWSRQELQSHVCPGANLGPNRKINSLKAVSEGLATTIGLCVNADLGCNSVVSLSDGVTMYE